MKHRILRWALLGPALVLLNESLTFYNVWPTLAVQWYGALSVELGACIVIMAAVSRRPPSRWALRGISAAWVLMILGRFADVTAPSLYGREINLYWDLRHLSGVAGMLAAGGSPRLAAEVLLAALLTLGFLYAFVRWAFGRVGDALGRPLERRVLGVLAAILVFVWAGQNLGFVPEGTSRSFAPTVSQAYFRQARLFLDALIFRRSPNVGGPGPIESDLANIKGADVLLTFIESYGAVSYERPAIADGLAGNRTRFESDIRSVGFDVVSAYVDAPTFGGGSWLAHLSLLSGVEVRDEDTNAVVMSQKRDTFVTPFARHGYRTVAIMPGLRQSWPEGAFYGFDQIYGAAQLDYRGPPFGWWIIPDQFAWARLDALEAERSPASPPFFVFFPTISSHTPFGPTPQYQPDWSRMLSEQPYDPEDLKQALAQEPALFDLDPSYVRSISYAFDSIAGFLKRHVDRDSVVILLGDHQPPAAVAGVGAPWHVPVHVIARRQEVIDRLLAHGFQRGLKPARPPIGPMNALLPILLDAFGSHAPAGAESTDARHHGHR